MIGLVLLLAGVGLTIGVGLTAALVAGSRGLGWVDRVGEESHKRHGRPVPNTGGIAIFAAVAGPTALILLAGWALPLAWWRAWAPAAAVHVPGLRSVTEVGLWLLAAVAALHGVGLIDDRRGLGPGLKLAVQTAAAAGLGIFADFRVLTLLSDYSPVGWGLSVALSALWIVLIVNAINFLDNMDGLAGGVGAIVAAIYLAATLIGGQWFVAGLAALLLGGLVGFLIFNFPPARIYMGDGGSLVVGLLLALISIRTTYIHSESARVENGPWYGLLMPLMVLAVPLYDAASVTAVRLAHGRSPWRGDHSHFSHRLVDRGLSRRRAVGVIWLATLATGLAGVMLPELAPWQALLAAAQTVAVLMLLALLEHGWRPTGD